MKAKLLPLQGKYYGTKIEIDFEDSSENEIIELWDSGNYEPSVRELESQGYTKEQWDNNELVDSGCIFICDTPIKELDIVCDSHFESETTYKRALQIINKLNK